MTKRFLFLLRNPCLPLLIACAVIALHFFPVYEAFQITSSKKRTVSTASFTTAAAAAAAPIGFPPLVSVGKKKIGTCLFDKQQQYDDDDTQAAKEEEQVEVGTKEYYSGFLSSPIQDETVVERGSGLEQALKLGGGAVLVLIVLVAGFLASNGLI